MLTAGLPGAVLAAKVVVVTRQSNCHLISATCAEVRRMRRSCQKRFNDRTNTPMAGLRTPPEIVAAALHVRTEGLGVRATGRSFGKAHASILRWERRLSETVPEWSPLAPEGADISVEGDEVYTRVHENRPP
jgi:hypothetical protein